MDAEALEKFRDTLTTQLSELQEATLEHGKQLDESHTTRDFVGGDRAAELESMEVDASVAESEINLAKKIQHALERVENGTYGICESCQNEIPLARLEAKPSVSLCLPCQEAHEAGA